MNKAIPAAISIALILATGMSGIPNVPTFKGTDAFKGEQFHSSKYPGGEHCVGKKCVVIGSNNNNHVVVLDGLVPGEQ